VSRPSIKGTVIGANGLPVPDAVVTIWDQDVGGNGNDRLMRTTTGSDGVFYGRSREWRDTNTTRVPNPVAWMPGSRTRSRLRCPTRCC
jgi:protocatechuate 3,4-dioxygenase beta subunit